MSSDIVMIFFTHNMQICYTFSYISFALAFQMPFSYVHSKNGSTVPLLFWNKINPLHLQTFLKKINTTLQIPQETDLKCIFPCLLEYSGPEVTAVLHILT